ncbi:glucose repression mediator protein [Gurleya vavrai]
MHKKFRFGQEMKSLWLEIAHGYAMMGVYKTSIQLYQNSLFYDKENVNALYGLGKLYIGTMDLKQAREIISKLENNGNEEFKISVIKGHYYLKKNEIDKSYKYFKKACDMSGGYDSFFLYGLGLFYEAIGNNELAKKIYLRHYNQYNFYDLNVDILFRLGVIFKNEKDEDIAMRIFNVLLQMNDLRIIDKNDVNLQIAHFFEKKNDFETSKFIIIKIIQNEPENLHACRLLAWVFFKFKKYEECIDFLSKTYDEIEDAYIFYILGRCFYSLKRYNEAFEMYRKAIICDKLNPWFWNSIGILYLKNEQYKESKKKFLTAIQIDNRFFEPKKNLKLSNIIQHSEKDKENTEKNHKIQYLDVIPDIQNTPYFNAQNFLGGPIYNVDKNKINSYELNLDFNEFDID